MRFAVPKKGRLEEPATRMLQQAGFRYERSERTLSVPVRGRNVELLFVRADDICELVTDGVADLGITGLDLVAESGADIEILAELGFGQCHLAAAVPNTSRVQAIDDLEGMRVATSHINVTRQFFAGKGIEVQTVPLRGSIEVAPKLDVADAIVDLVSSGSTMMLNGLRPIAEVLSSQAVLIRDRSADQMDEVDSAVTLIAAVVAARRKKYVLMNAPAAAVAEIRELIPGFDAPSIVPLAAEGMVAIHSVVDVDAVWDVVPQLKAAGASGILVLPIEQLLV